MPVQEQIRDLTDYDRCDRCNAKGKALAVMPSRLELVFCQHHMNVHGGALVSQDAQISTKRDYEESEIPF